MLLLPLLLPMLDMLLLLQLLLPKLQSAKLTDKSGKFHHTCHTLYKHLAVQSKATFYLFNVQTLSVQKAHFLLSFSGLATLIRGKPGKLNLDMHNFKHSMVC